MITKTIGLIAPGCPVTPGAIELSVIFLRNLGFDVKVGEKTTTGIFPSLEGCPKGGVVPPLEGCGVVTDDKQRAAELTQMFTNNEINAIMALRGGYGCGRILEFLDYELIQKNKKPLFGYSDITALHIALNQKAGLYTYHTPMPATELIHGADDYTMEYLMRCLHGITPFGLIRNPPNIPMKKLIGGKCGGVLTGGNLCVITSLLGTPYEINTKHKILFLEDVDEPPYKIDRMFLQMRLAGKFADSSGFLLGSFTQNGKPIDEKVLAEIFANHLVRYGKPVIYGFSCGHTIPTASLPLGQFMHINANTLHIEVN